MVENLWLKRLKERQEDICCKLCVCLSLLYLLFHGNVFNSNEEEMIRAHNQLYFAFYIVKFSLFAVQLCSSFTLCFLFCSRNFFFFILFLSHLPLSEIPLALPLEWRKQARMMNYSNNLSNSQLDCLKLFAVMCISFSCN